MDRTKHLDRSVGHGRLRRGAGLLIAAFWSAHFFIALFRAEISDRPGRELFEGISRRILFALLGALVSYILYRCLRRLLVREFGRQMMIGAAFALAAACVQTALNVGMFMAGDSHLLGNIISLILYWFWFFFSWAAAYLALSYSITVQEQERHAAELRVQAQEAQNRALRYQINPHFLFNTLNAIAALVRDAPGKAEEMVMQLSDFFRRSLAVNPMEDVTLAQEADLQRLYLEIERTRFPDRLRFDVALDPGTSEARVPAMLLQPLIENSVKHGVARSEGPTCIRIRSRLDGPVLEIVVENDARSAGTGAGGESVGLRNVAERLRSRFGAGAALITAGLPDGGFRNILRIPLRT